MNGSPIETLSAWMRSRPHKVVEMHRSYMQGSNRSTSKKVREELIYLVVYLMVIDDSKRTMLLTILAVRFISKVLFFQCPCEGSNYLYRLRVNSVTSCTQCTIKLQYWKVVFY